VICIPTTLASGLSAGQVACEASGRGA
jgi:hypothetical protein